MLRQIKRSIVIILILIVTVCLSGCHKEPTLADQIRESDKRLEEAREKEREAKEELKRLQDAYDILTQYQNNK